MRRKIWKTLFISLLLTVTSCATLPPDDPFCVETSMVEGFCVHPISGKTFRWNETNKYLGRTWWEQRPAMVMVPAGTLAANKAFVIKMCKKYNNCDKAVPSWERSLDTLENEVSKKLP